MSSGWEQLSIGGVGAPSAPSVVEARAEIARLHADGLGFEAIARSLNARGVPTPSGRGRWWPSTARRHTDPSSWREYIRSYRARQR